MPKPKPPEPMEQWTIKPPRSVALAVDKLAKASGQSRNAYVVDLLKFAADHGWVRESGTPVFRDGGVEDGAAYGAADATEEGDH